MKKLIFVLTLILSSVCFSESNIIYGLATKHIVTQGLNEDNNLIVVSYKNWHFGNMINSYESESYIFGRKFETNNSNLNFGMSVNLVNGYDKEIFEMGLDNIPSITYDGDKDLLIVPEFHMSYNLMQKADLIAIVLGEAINIGLKFNF